MTTGLSISEINAKIEKGATINDDGTIEMPPVTTTATTVITTSTTTSVTSTTETSITTVNSTVNDDTLTEEIEKTSPVEDKSSKGSSVLIIILIIIIAILTSVIGVFLVFKKKHSKPAPPFKWNGGDRQ